MSYGGRIVKALVGTAIAVPVAAFGGCEARKAYFDAQVRRLCEKDGGITVVEPVKLTRAQMNAMPRTGGRLSVPSKSAAQASDPVYWISETTSLRTGNPAVWRTEYSFVRIADTKVVGKAVFYSRRGGDFPSLAHPSSFGCPNEADFLSSSEAIFDLAETDK